MMIENGAIGLRKLFIMFIVIIDQDGLAEMSISHLTARDNRTGHLAFLFYSCTGWGSLERWSWQGPSGGEST